jgi:uncharacterized protein (TIGR02391 family)
MVSGRLSARSCVHRLNIPGSLGHSILVVTDRQMKMTGASADNSAVGRGRLYAWLPILLVLVSPAMANRRSKPEPLRIEIKQFKNSAEIDRAITKLKNRIDVVKNLDPRQIRYDDQRVYNVQDAISNTILDVFGPNSPEHNRNGHIRIRHGPMYTGISPEECQQQFAEGIPRTVTLIEGLIQNLEEKRANLGDDLVARVREAFDGMDLHPRLAAVSVDLFRDGHYRNAVLDASVALMNFVKEKSRRHDLDGAVLMRTVFSKNNPILAFNELQDQSELDEQEGLMHLFEGAALFLRNPRAHDLSPDSPEEALEFIGFRLESRVSGQGQPGST